MRIFITGGTGFIGRNLVEQLADRFEVLAPPRSELDLLDDAAVGAWLGRHRIDAIVHAATTPGHRNAKNVENLATKNLRMFFNLVSRRDRFARFILLGSGLEYDMRHYRPKMPETYFGEHVPEDEGGFSKFLCSRYAETQAGFVVLRMFGVYGKHEDWQIRFISNAICKAICERPITVKQNRRFDYVSVDDVVSVVGHFLTHDAKHPAYNVTPDASMEICRLAEIVREVSGKPVEIRVGAPGMGIEYSGDNARLRREAPDLPLTPIREGIERLYAWYRSNSQLIRAEAIEVDP